MDRPLYMHQLEVHRNTYEDPDADSRGEAQGTCLGELLLMIANTL